MQSDWSSYNIFGKIEYISRLLSNARTTFDCKGIHWGGSKCKIASRLNKFALKRFLSFAHIRPELNPRAQIKSPTLIIVAVENIAFLRRPLNTVALPWWWLQPHCSKTVTKLFHFVGMTLPDKLPHSLWIHAAGRVKAASRVQSDLGKMIVQPGVLFEICNAQQTRISILTGNLCICIRNQVILRKEIAFIFMLRPAWCTIYNNNSTKRSSEVTKQIFCIWLTKQFK